MKNLSRKRFNCQPLTTPLFDYSLQQFLTGRIWIKEELPFIEDTIHYHVSNQFIETIPGILKQKKISCQRCKNQDQNQFHTYHCALCEGSCTYCLQCIQLGRISSCTKLVRWTGAPVIQQTNGSMTWSGQLTENQQRSSEEVIESLSKGKHHLIHAVTGAGKTEILFPVIEFALKKDLRLCIASPRTDVVVELLPRIQKAFSTIDVQAIYGGSGVSKKYTKIILSTTHQLYRFDNAFDVVIVDEVDAFPYSYDSSLQRAVEKSLTTSGSLVFMTATPSKKQLHMYKEKNAYSFLARRFHGDDLPIPQYSALWNHEKDIRKGKIPTKLKKRMQKWAEEEKRFLLFFPTIELMLLAEKILIKDFNQIASVYAEDPIRHEKVQKLRSKQLKGLLTTTILERGITIENLQVAIIGTEHKVFSSAALIQISGRVGRSKDYSTGEIIFFHHGITRRMDEAIRIMKNTNKIGNRI